MEKDMRALDTPPKPLSMEEYYKGIIAEQTKQLYEAYKRIAELQKQIKRMQDGQN
jgi:hypothetical protein